MTRNNMLKIVAAVVMFFMCMFNNDCFYFWLDDEEGAVAYAQAPAAQTMDDLYCFGMDLQGENASWLPSCDGVLTQAVQRLQTDKTMCAKVTGTADEEGFRQTIAELPIAVSGGRDALQSSRAFGRQSLGVVKLQMALRAASVDAGRAQAGALVIDHAQRGIIISFEKCPMPEPGPQGPPGKSAETKVNIDYDLGWQGMYGDEGTLHSVIFRTNWPATENIFITAGAQYGAIDGKASAGAELSATYRNPWVNPKVVMMGRALELDTRLAFARAEFGGGVGLERTLGKPWLVGEIRYERKWLGEAPDPHYIGIDSVTGLLVVRFGGINGNGESKEGGAR